MDRRYGSRARIETTERCWTKKTVYYYNRLDVEMMEGEIINKVKTYVRNWVKENVQVFHDN